MVCAAVSEALCSSVFQLTAPGPWGTLKPRPEVQTDKPGENTLCWALLEKQAGKVLGESHVFAVQQI